MRNRPLATLAAASAWLWLVLQTWLDITRELGRGGTAWAALWNMAFYLTILTNVIAAVVFTWAARRERGGGPLVAAATLYIALMALLNHFLMGGIHGQFSLRWVANFGLHYVTPALCFVAWLAGEPKDGLNYRHPWLWLSYPLAYAAYALARGALGGRYPYWVIDANKLGFSGALANAGKVIVLFIVAGHLLVAAARWRASANAARTAPAA